MGRWREGKYAIDLSKPDCHVCGDKLIRDMAKEQWWCVGSRCQVRRIKFSIPYSFRKTEGEKDERDR